MNAIHPIYITKLGFCTRKIDIGIEKIDGSYLNTFGIVLADYSVKNKLGKMLFFNETFLLVSIGLDVVLGMPLLTLNKVNVWFTEREFV